MTSTKYNDMITYILAEQCVHRDCMKVRKYGLFCEWHEGCAKAIHSSSKTKTGMVYFEHLCRHKMIIERCRNTGNNPYQ